jgi:hypothetical protein
MVVHRFVREGMKSGARWMTSWQREAAARRRKGEGGGARGGWVIMIRETSPVGSALSGPNQEPRLNQSDVRA